MKSDIRRISHIPPLSSILRVRDVRPARGVRWRDARDRPLHVVVNGVQRQNSVRSVQGEHRGSSVKWLNGNTLKIRGRARQELPEPLALAQILVQRRRLRGFDQTFASCSPHNPREERLQPSSRAPIACVRHVGAPCIVSCLRRLKQTSKSNDFRKSRYPCRRYRRVGKTSALRAGSDIEIGISA